ncbi:MAG: VC2046/SO_2500 family protein, partial [Shewanella sp.]
MQAAAIIINEAHLGDRLGRAISTGRRGEFGLLLARLSEDVREFAEFVKKSSEPLDEQLAKHFEIPQAQRLRDVPG